eukprot:1156681-Lingulodinium_polyedra.AAC.1
MACGSATIPGCAHFLTRATMSAPSLAWLPDAMATQVELCAGARSLGWIKKGFNDCCALSAETTRKLRFWKSNWRFDAFTDLC